MKSILFLLIGGFLLTTVACKKGDKDPFISLLSRKMRLAGEYNIESWNLNSYYKRSEGDSRDERLEINGNEGTNTLILTESNGDSQTIVQNITIQKGDFIIQRDGIWSFTYNTTTKWTEVGDEDILTNDITVIQTIEQSGTWFFIGGQGKEFKNKERVLFGVLDLKETNKKDEFIVYADGSTSTNNGFNNTYTNKYPNGEVSLIYEIEMLKGKKMTFVQDLSGADTKNILPGPLSEYYTSYTTGRSELKLIQK